MTETDTSTKMYTCRSDNQCKHRKANTNAPTDALTALIFTRESLTLLSDESGVQTNQTAEHIHGI